MDEPTLVSKNALGPNTEWPVLDLAVPALAEYGLEDLQLDLKETKRLSARVGYRAQVSRHPEPQPG